MTRAEQYIEKNTIAFISFKGEIGNLEPYTVKSISPEHAKTACEIAVLEGRLMEVEKDIENLSENDFDTESLEHYKNFLESQIKAKEEQ